MKFYCIADENTVRGFRLVGLDGEVVTSARQAASAVDALASRPDCGILILTDKVAAGIRPKVDQIRMERSRPFRVNG